MFWIPCPLRVITFVGMFVNAWCVAAATSAPSYESDEDTRPRPASAHDRHQTDDAQAYARTGDLSVIEDESPDPSLVVKPDATECDQTQTESQETVSEVRVEPSAEEGETQQAKTADAVTEEGPANEETIGDYERPGQGEDLTEDVPDTSPTDSVSMETESEEADEVASDEDEAGHVGDHEDVEPAPAEPEESVPENVAEDENNAQAATCWVTKSGHSYHTDPACRAVRKSTLHEIPLQEAEEKGYEPCGICAI